MIPKSNESKPAMGVKDKPRSGAAMGVGAGKGGYNAGAVNSAVKACGMAAPKYYERGGVPAKNGKGE